MANPYMPLFVGDYLKDTGELTNEEHGVYLKLLMFMWSQGGFLKNDPRVLCRLTGVSYRRWAPIWANLERYFYVDGDTLRHTKVEKTLRKARDISRKRSVASAKMHTKKSNKNNETASASVDQNRQQRQCIQTKGLDSPLRGENPNLPDDRAEIVSPSDRAADASAPSALEARGLAPLPDCARLILEELRTLNNSGRVSSGDLREFRAAVQGERAGRVVLHPTYEPPDRVAEVIARQQPQLTAIEGGKS